MRYISPDQGDTCSLRLLLLHRPADGLLKLGSIRAQNIFSLTLFLQIRSMHALNFLSLTILLRAC